MKTQHKLVSLSIPIFVIDKSPSDKQDRIGNWKIISLSMDCDASEYSVTSNAEF